MCELTGKNGWEKYTAQMQKTFSRPSREARVMDRRRWTRGTAKKLKSAQDVTVQGVISDRLSSRTHATLLPYFSMCHSPSWTCSPPTRQRPSPKPRMHPLPSQAAARYVSLDCNHQVKASQTVSMNTHWIIFASASRELADGMR
jgi:hypothetical protein